MQRPLAWASLLLLSPVITVQWLVAETVARPRARIVASVNDSARVPLRGSVHPLARPEFDRGAAPADLPMQRMMMVLRRSPEQQQALDVYVSSLRDRNSPTFHRWLSPEEFGEQFGIAQPDIDKIQSWLQSHGLNVEAVSKGRNVIEFSGTATQVQAAFNTEIRAYQVGQARHFANSRNPEIPEALSPVVGGVVSLNNFFSHPSAHVLAGAAGTKIGVGKAKPAFTFFNPLGDFVYALVPDDLQTIYNAAPLLAGKERIGGAGQKIAVVARSNIDELDFRGFRTLFQPFARQDALQIVVNGIDPGRTYDDDMVETAADVEYAGAMAPDADIVLVVSASTNDSDGIALSALYAIDNDVAPVMSVSYGACEAALGTAGNQFYSALWEQAAAQGITVIVSSGDGGPAGCEQPFASGDPEMPAVARTGPGVNGLASTPYNIAVGGTQFAESAHASYWAQQGNAAFGSALSYVPEAAWNESCSPYACDASKANFAAGGGGPSTCTESSTDVRGVSTCNGNYPKPAWQTGVGVPDDGARNLPDISLAAAARDGYVLCFDGSCAVDEVTGSFNFYLTAGTSLSAPAFAGVMALVNQRTGSRQGQAAPFLYSLAQADAVRGLDCDGSAPGPGFDSCTIRDVTRGDTNIPCAGGSSGCSESAPETYGTLSGYVAVPGYDLATGLGSVNVANLVDNWGNESRASTKTALSISLTTSRHGQPVQVASSVEPQAGGGVPTGEIVLYARSGAGNETVAEQDLTNGNFSGRLLSLPGGTYQVFARYAGDDEFAPSASPGVSVTVAPEASTTALEAFLQRDGQMVSADTAVPYGARVVLRAHVQGASGVGGATGTVSLSGVVPPPGAPINAALPLNNEGVAEVKTVLDALGPYAFTASYSGDESFDPSTSGVLKFVSVKATPTVAASASTTSVTASGLVQAHVAIDTTSLALPPSGTVSLLLGGNKLQSAKLTGYRNPGTGNAFATAEVNIQASRLAIGANSLSVSYSGDDNYEGASSVAPVVITVDPAAKLPGAQASVSLSANKAVAMSNEVVTLEATVTRDSVPVAGGTVTFFDGLRELGTVQVVGTRPAPGFVSGTATWKTRLSPGAHGVRARFDGLGRALQPAVSPAVALSVNGSVPTNSVLTANENTQNLAAYDLTLSVLAGNPSPAKGSATFREAAGGTMLGQVELSVPKQPLVLLPAQTLAVDDQPIADGVAVASADLNGDGIPDAVTANADDNSITVLLGRGDGTFAAPTRLPLDGSPIQIVLVDANQDGIPDVFAAMMNGAVNVLLGNGDGTFRSAGMVPVGDSATAIVQGDFNSDGIPDLAAYSGVASSIEASPCIFILLGNGDGTFRRLGTYLSGEVVTGLALADFDHDGAVDLLASGPTGLYLLAGNGDGSFNLRDARPYDGSGSYFLSQLSHPVTEDFNGDGVADLAAVPDMLPYEVLVIGGNADGSFQPPQTLAPAGLNYFDAVIDEARVAVADINADGLPDLVQMLVGTSLGKSISGLYLYLANGYGTFTEAEFLSIPEWEKSPPESFTLADLNADGLADVMATTRGVSSTGLTSALLQNVSVATFRALLGGGTHAVQAGYIPSSTNNYLPSSSNVLTLTELIPTVSTLEAGYKNTQGSCSLSGASAAIYWGSVPCFYLHVIAKQSGAPASTGTVTLSGTSPAGAQFSAGPYTIYPDGNGGAYLYIFYDYGLGDAGQYALSMNYSGDGNYQASGSGGATVTLQPLLTTTVLSGPSRILAGNPAVVTAQIASPVLSNVSLSGTVAIYDGTTLLQRNDVVTNTSTLAMSGLPAGTHNLTAKFEGMPGQFGTLNAASSVSTVWPVTVYDRNMQSAPDISLDLTPTEPVAGQALTLDARVLNANGDPLTTGTVTFLDGSTALSTVALSGDGSATLRRPFAVGPHAVVARYNGIAHLALLEAQTQPAVFSTSNNFTIEGPAASATTLAAAASTASNQLYDLSASLFAYGPIAPRGTIFFEDASTGEGLGTVPVDATMATPAFGDVRTIPFNGNPGNTVTADFNDDGLPDLAIADARENAIHVLLANRDGTFSQADYALPAQAIAIAIANLNRDGTDDLVVGTANNQIDVLLGQSDGSFRSSEPVALAFTPASILSGDVNGDGTDDIVVTGGAESTSLAVLLGNGDGTLTSPVEYAIPRLSAGSSALLQDLNGDGVLDLLMVTNHDATYMMFGVGDGKFQTPLPLNEMDGTAIAADLNGDGRPDLVFTSPNGSVAIQLGRGDGSFTPPRFYGSIIQADTSSAAVAAAVVDVNGDGIPDLIAPGFILLGMGDGTFTQKAIPCNETFSALDDFNSDGVPDVAGASDGTLAVQFGGTTISATLSGTQVRGAGKHEIRAVFTPADGNPYQASASAPVTLQAFQTTQSALSLQRTFPANGNARYGQSVTVTAKVIVPNGTPTGSVLFAIDNEVQQQVDVTGDGVANFTWTPIVAGKHTLSASYSGDSAFSPTTNSIVIRIDPAAPMVLLNSSCGNANLGSTVRFLTSVQGQPGMARPTGTVVFQDGNVQLGATQLDSSGLAKYASGDLSAGTHEITASYSGDANFAPVLSSVLTQTITAPDFQVAVSPSTIYLSRGGQGTATITTTAIGGYSGLITLQCGVPITAIACSFAPASFDLDGATISRSTTLTITVEAQPVATGGITSLSLFGRMSALLGAVLIGLPGPLLFGSSTSLHRSKRRLLLAALCVMPIAMLVSCGGAANSTSSNKAPTSYLVPVTVSGSTSSRSLELKVVIE
jgi:Pro-kumamolisin, activation domain/Bacterial Ig-like domain (group 3)/FG-GAP-like repeat